MKWDINPGSPMSAARFEAARASDKVDRYSDDLTSLKRSVERLTLACQSMWELLRESGSFSEEMLQAKMLEIDARDGAIDGRISARLVICPSCGVKSNSKRDSCIMCGAALPRQHTFEA